MAANTCNQPPFNGNGTGAQADYVFGFEYINRADVEVYVGEPGNWTQYTEGNAANADEYQWQNATTIRLNAATGTDNVLITRETDRCDPAVEFFAGTSIRAEDLNANQEQTLFLIQELAETMSENGMDQPPGSDGITLDDLEDVNITTPANPSWLRWNGTEWQDQPILQSGDTWSADDNHVVTAARGDARWLQGGAAGDVNGGDGINIDTSTPGEITISVDLDNPSGLEFDGGELRIDANSGCEIVADGLNTETTDASIVQTGGDNEDPAIRVATTLGATTTNNDLQITGGANVTVTRNNDNQLTIAAAAATGGATFRGTVDVDNNNTLPGTTGQQNPNAVAVGDGFTVENNVAAADVTANWNTVLDNWDTADGIINSGDVILCTTAAAAGSPTDARYNLIRTGGNINTLQQVTDAGNTTTNAIVLDDTSLQIQEGTDTLTINWPTGTADRTISFPDAGGTVALAGDVPGAANDGQININAGNGLTATGDNATANQAGNTTRTLTVQAANNTINVAAGGISVNAANLPLDARYVAVAGDTMTGNLVMDDANITGAENAITAGAGNWDFDNGNFWTLADIAVPNPTNMAEGISGLIVNTAAATWPAAGGATFQYAANTPPNITEFPAVIPFYCTNNTTIFIGTPTVNIT